jgi:hypothetical protein
MDVIQYSAWAIDRAIETAKVKTDVEVTAESIINDAKEFADFMDKAIQKSDEVEKMIEDEVTKRLEVELNRIQLEEANGIN